MDLWLTNKQSWMPINLDSHKVVLYTLLLIGLSYLMNHFMRDDMYKVGVNMIYRMQKDATPNLISLFNWISLLVDPFVVTLTMILWLLLVDNKFRVLVILLFFLINAYLLGETKAMYAESRPYWTNSEIKCLQWYCPMDFGNPSGHSWLAGTLYYLLIIEYLGSGPFHIFLSVPLIIAFIVPVSRMYLGAHSANQVLQGVVNSFGLLVIYRFGLHDFLRDWANCFLKLSKKYKHYLRNTILVNVAMTIFPMLCYAYNRMYSLPDNQIENIKQKCGLKEGVTELIDEKLLLMSCAVQVGFGLLYGISVMGANFRFYFGLWKYTDTGNPIVLRIQKILLGDVVFMLPVVVAWGLTKVLPWPYMQYLVLSAGMLSAGYIYSAYAAKWMVKYGIIRIVSSSSL